MIFFYWTDSVEIEVDKFSNARHYLSSLETKPVKIFVAKRPSDLS